MKRLFNSTSNQENKKTGKNKEVVQEFLKETFKIPVNGTNLDKAVQESATQNEAELIVRLDSLKKENKKLVAKVNSVQTELNHVSESYISHLIMLHGKPRYEGTSLRD